ncbi:DEAD/DEAH box helicase [Lentibacillus sp. Marseille-P4043]|uniref:DEAD/DEAH box helicase n=1 Tax=Lentibacillus sp. Marseille-P4043 TaxID=2040293 RepID=UPI000D0BBAAC|nr:DEAD/DEAH box helicase family protein [Lentibacillus sp. Marseille-P4043]
MNSTEALQDYSKHFSGKLLLRSEIPLEDEAFQQLVITGHFTPFSSITKTFYQQQCNRCGNKQASLFAKIPCQSCHKVHLYCRKCIEMGRVMECEYLYQWTGPHPDWSTHKDPCFWDGELTDHQQSAADRIVTAIGNKESELLVWAVCGAGKTEMLFQGITKSLQLGQRICLATPRADVVRELLPRIKQAFPHVSIQGLYGGSEEKVANAQFILATTHQLLRFKHAFDVLIIDEIDAFPFHADASLPFAASRAKRTKGTMIYLTATPRKIQRMQIERKKLPHVFVPIRFHGHPLPIPTLKMCLNLKKNLANTTPPKTFLKWMKNRINPKRQLLVFVPTIKLAERLKTDLTRRLLATKVLKKATDITFVHASDPDREKKVQLFREKQIFVLVTTTILERGVTFPSVDVVVFDAGHVVFDEAALVQIAGRAGRSPDDPTGEILFLHDGKTEAMVQAVRSIRNMNKRGGFR